MSFYTMIKCYQQPLKTSQNYPLHHLKVYLPRERLFGLGVKAVTWSRLLPCDR